MKIKENDEDFNKKKADFSNKDYQQPRNKIQNLDVSIQEIEKFNKIGFKVLKISIKNTTIGNSPSGTELTHFLENIIDDNYDNISFFMKNGKGNAELNHDIINKNVFRNIDILRSNTDKLTNIKEV